MLWYSTVESSGLTSLVESSCSPTGFRGSRVRCRHLWESQGENHGRQFVHIFCRCPACFSFFLSLFSRKRHRQGAGWETLWYAHSDTQTDTDTENTAQGSWWKKKQDKTQSSHREELWRENSFQFTTLQTRALISQWRLRWCCFFNILLKEEERKTKPLSSPAIFSFFLPHIYVEAPLWKQIVRSAPQSWRWNQRIEHFRHRRPWWKLMHSSEAPELPVRFWHQWASTATCLIASQSSLFTTIEV